VALTGVLLLSPLSLRADPQPVLRRLGAADGLPNSVVYGIAQDSRGFMWLATEGGLLRHDGRAFQQVPLRESAAEPEVRKDISTILRGSSDVVWVGTWGAGLVRFDPVSERQRHYHRRDGDPASLDDDRVQTVHEDRSGRLWVGTFSGLNRLDGQEGRIVRVDLSGGDPAYGSQRVWSIASAADGRLWVGTERGVSVLDAAGTVVSRFALPAGTGPAEPRARVLFVDAGGVVWAGGQAGVHRFDAAAGRFLRFEAAGPLLAGAIITGIVEGPDGALWVGTLGKGVARIAPRRDGAELHGPDPWHPGRLPHGDVRALLIDRAGLLWIGTRGGGIGQIDLRPAVVELVGGWRGDGAANGREIAAVHQEPDGTLWAGSLDGLTRIDPSGRVTRIRHDPARHDSLSPDLVRAIAGTGDGRLWVGTLNGLDRLDAATGRAEHFRTRPGDPGSLSHNAVNAVLVDRRGRVWVGTQAGLNRLDAAASGFLRFTSGAAGLSDDFVRVLLEDGEGSIWLGTDIGGVCRWRDDDRRFQCFRQGSAADTLSDDRIFTLHEGEDGAIWVGTAAGLSLIEPRSGRVERWGRQRGAPTTEVYGVLTDRSGGVWLSSGRGLHWFDPESGRSRGFADVQGQRGLAFSRGASFPAADGTLLFGAQGGLVRVHPARLRPFAADPPLAFTEIAVDEVPLDQPLGTLSVLNLPYRVKSFRVSFAGLDYHNPDAFQYSYRLDRFEERWRDAGSTGMATYTNLDPGEYVLRVRLGAAGAAGGAGLELPVHIRPPWWETGGFRLLLFLVITSVTATVVVARVAMLKRAQRALGRLVDERTTQLVQANRLLEQQARTDGLTSLANYRAFSEALEHEWQRARRDRRPMSVLMLDVDRFKTYNDTYGHRAGDEALRRVAHAIAGLGKRDGDLVARYGGDEFSMILISADRDGAVQIGEHARSAVESLPLQDPDRTVDRLSLSIGVATTVPGPEAHAEDLLRAADQALYEAKRRGRNCVVSRVLVSSGAPDGHANA
jgi:diguanylate cyclase (GGDEF)-like protein